MSIPTSSAVESSSLESSQPCRQLSFSEIRVAAQDFDESLIIGHGGFGKVYKGTIVYGTSRLTVAIKRLDSSSNQGAVEFWAEVEMLSKLRQCHLVSLIGYCNEGQEMILVYEYMPNGTLADRLHKCLRSLTWVRRLKICIGAARGLDYLHAHMGIKPRVIHRDVKSSNILLDSNWEAKISDFGLSKIGPTNQPSTTYVNTLVRGTFGYLDPHYYQTGRLTRRSDVYAFGVVLFEVLCRKKAVFETPDEEPRGLASWAQDSIKEGRLKHIVDHNLREAISPKCLKEFAQLADRCLHSNPKQRPTMAEIVVGLESILALHEKTNNRLHPEGMTIFGKKVPMFFSPSNWENSVEGISSKSLDMYLYTVGGEDLILRRFDFKTIVDATKNFSEANKIWGLSLFSMYKGRLQNGQDIAIALYYHYEECINEVSILIKVEHENLAELFGYCIEGTKAYLVYDFAPYATLADLLIFDRKRARLDWDAWYKIILGVARALVYLHKHAPVRIMHGDVAPSNILLDENFDPKLFGFHCAISKASNETDDVELVRHIGTSGYIAPERTKCHVSTKSDVFSFGVLVLKAITGGTTFDISRHQCIEMLLEYVYRNRMEVTHSNIIDPRIDVDSSSITKFIHIGLLCIQYEATDRPSMEEVVAMLLGSSSASLPIPKKPHVPY